MHIRFGLLGLLILSACATDAPVERVSRDTFLVRTHIVGSLSGGPSARAENAKRAAQYCAGRHLPMTVLNEETVGGVLPQDTLKFRCGNAARGSSGVSPWD